MPEDIPYSKENFIRVDRDLESVKAKISPNTPDAELVTAVHRKSELGRMRESLLNQAHIDALKENERLDEKVRNQKRVEEIMKEIKGGRLTLEQIASLSQEALRLQQGQRIKRSNPVLSVGTKAKIKELLIGGLDPFGIFHKTTSLLSPKLKARMKEDIKDVLDPFQIFHKRK